MIRRAVFARATLGRPLTGRPEARQAAHPRAALEREKRAKRRTAEADPPDGTGIPPRSGGGAPPKIRSLKDAEEFGWDLGAAGRRGAGTDARTAKASKVRR